MKHEYASGLFQSQFKVKIAKVQQDIDGERRTCEATAQSKWHKDQKLGIFAEPQPDQEILKIFVETKLS